MTTDLQVCNMALSHLGARSIASLAGTDRVSVECAIHYPQARDNVLRDFPWNFAERRPELVLVDDGSEVPGFTYIYEYPTDCVVARYIFNYNDYDDRSIPFTVVANDDLDGKWICTDEADAILVYTAQITDISLWDAAAVTALSWRLASDLSVPITKKLARQQACYQIYTGYLSGTQAANAKEGQNQQELPKTFIDARG